MKYVHVESGHSPEIKKSMFVEEREREGKKRDVRVCSSSGGGVDLSLATIVETRVAARERVAEGRSQWSTGLSSIRCLGLSVAQCFTPEGNDRFKKQRIHEVISAVCREHQFRTACSGGRPDGPILG